MISRARDALAEVGQVVKNTNYVVAGGERFVKQNECTNSFGEICCTANNFPVKFSSPNNGFAPLALHKFQYVSYQTFHSITPGCIHRLQKETNV